MATQFSWTLLSDAGDEIKEMDERFGSQEDAENWMGDHWRELADQGAASVSLRRAGEVVYDMSLAPE
ncbi:MAG: hypothetical protein M3280_05390 [Actinomycetota bacterium]|nr:hypothetical protein [Actinomycetota bacterium]